MKSSLFPYLDTTETPEPPSVPKVKRRPPKKSIPSSIRPSFWILSLALHGLLFAYPLWAFYQYSQKKARGKASLDAKIAIEMSKTESEVTATTALQTPSYPPPPPPTTRPPAKELLQKAAPPEIKGERIEAKRPQPRYLQGKDSSKTIDTRRPFNWKKDAKLRRIEKLIARARQKARREEAQKRREKAEKGEKKKGKTSDSSKGKSGNRGARTSYRARYYPRRCRRRGHEGKVVLRVWINNRGQCTKTKVLSHEGCYRLEDAARRSARDSRFIPARKEGEKVGSWKRLVYNFKLR